MQKTNTLWLILKWIFPVLFNILFFASGGTEHKASVWISYAFIHFAYVMLVFTPHLIRDGKSWEVFAYSIYAISAVYFLVEFFTGLTFILTAPESYTAALSVQLGLAAVYGVMLVSYMLANEKTAQAEEERSYEIACIKNTSAQVKGLLEQVQDKEARRAVERAYDTLYTSPVKSHPDLAHLEERIMQCVNALEGVVSAGDRQGIVESANFLLSAVNERNRKLKTLF